MPLIFIKKCLFPSSPLVCALGRPASMPVTSPRWDILGKLEKEEAMDYLQTWFANENLLAGMICTTLWQCSPSGTWVVMLLGLTAVLGGLRTAWVAKSSRILRWWWWVTTNHAQVQQLLRPGLGLGHIQQLRAHPRQGFKYSRGFFFLLLMQIADKEFNSSSTLSGSICIHNHSKLPYPFLSNGICSE